MTSLISQQPHGTSLCPKPYSPPTGERKLPQASQISIKHTWYTWKAQLRGTSQPVTLGSYPDGVQHTPNGSGFSWLLKLLSKQHPEQQGLRGKRLRSDISDLFIILDSSHKDTERGPMGATPSVVCSSMNAHRPPSWGLFLGDRGSEMLKCFLWFHTASNSRARMSNQLIFCQASLNQPLPAWVFFSVKQRLKSDLYFIKFSFGLNENGWKVLNTRSATQ